MTKEGFAVPSPEDTEGLSNASILIIIYFYIQNVSLETTLLVLIVNMNF